MSETLPERVAAVRAFNRFYTNVIGLVHGMYLDMPYSLTEARLLYEMARRDVTQVADLRRALDIDAGYLSRGLGQADAYPFMISGPVVEKLRFVHDTVAGAK